jgi:hypothetical protein
LTPGPGEELPPVGVLDEADAEEQDDIEGVISQVADEAATVQVKRWNPAPDDPARPWDYVTTVAAREFSVETIKREYGGGRYKAVTLDRSKKYVRGGTHIFNIDKMFKPQPSAPSPDASVPSVVVSPGVAALAAKVDNLAALLQAHNSTKETLDMALKIAAVMGGGAARGMAPDTLFTTATKLIEFSRGLAGDGVGGGGGGADNDDDLYATAVKELVKPIAALIQSEVEQRSRVRLLNPSRPAALPAGEAPNMAGMPPWVVQLRPFIPQLLTLARENADPELYADVVYDLMERKLPTAQLQAVEAAAADAAFVDTVLAALPLPCVPFKEWFRALASNLKAAMTAPPSPGGDDEEEEEGAAPA